MDKPTQAGTSDRIVGGPQEDYRMDYLVVPLARLWDMQPTRSLRA